MAMQRSIRNFISAEDGGCTVEWVVISGGTLIISAMLWGTIGPQILYKIATILGNISNGA